MSQPEVTELTDEERDTYLKLQKKVGCKKTGTEVFESFFPVLPMSPCELAVVRNIDKRPHVLMWRRKDAHFDGWHMPGGYLLMGETDDEWISRILKKEANLDLRSYHFIRRFNISPSTGWIPNHILASYFYCDVWGEPSVGKFFPLTKIPQDTFGHHKMYAEYLRAYLSRMNIINNRRVVGDWIYGKAPEYKWLVVSPGVRGWREVCGTLDEAFKSASSQAGTMIIDDQGLQIF